MTLRKPDPNDIVIIDTFVSNGNECVYSVLITANERALEAMVQRARKNKGKKCVDGPITVQVS